MKLGSTVYHCKRSVDDNGYVSYSAPTAYILRLNYLTVMPYSGDMQTKEYGEDIQDKWTIYATDRDFANVFSEGDILFLDGKTPVDADGTGANAVITSVRPQNVMIKIVAEKLDLQGRGLHG